MKEIALHILDIAQNSIRAEADEIRITLSESLASDTLSLVIADNGKGMDEESCRRATDPYFTSRTTRKVGLGLPLLQMNSGMSGGNLTIESEPGHGTTVTATFRYSHVDRPPLGDVSGTIALLIISNPRINIIYIHGCEGREWSLSTSEIKEILGDDAVTDLSIVSSLREIINENVAEVRKFQPSYDKY
ncbi:MAG: ATP-binding protein [Bacteroidales bacterium]|jgi:anti-sigma regulatory factor (Ser/Thr protein kinase)|nr:ATP-binding protein [Bacteroidales bacterium]